MTLEQIFYSQTFRILIVVLMGVGGFVYFEVIKNLNLKEKYAFVIGVSLLGIGILVAGLNYPTEDLFNIASLKQKTQFGIEKLLFGGYAFTIYACLLLIKNKTKIYITRRLTHSLCSL